MNVKRITMDKIDYNTRELQDTQELYDESKDKLSKEANAFLRDKMSSYERNIEYYTEILKMLESEGK